MSDLMKVNRVVAEFCAETVAEPISFFSESDLQVALASKLREEFPAMIATKVKRGPQRNLRSTSTYDTPVVHTEYGAKKRRRIDIVVFSEEDLKSVDGYKLKRQKKYLNPRFGFELGTEAVSEIGKHLASDIGKLKDRVVERGYIIHFYRDTTLADTGTTNRRQKEASIQRRFRTPFERLQPDPKLVVLAFVLPLGRTNKRTRKCEFFCPSTRKKKWRYINIDKKKLAQTVLDYLKLL